MNTQNPWSQRGASLSDKSARKEYGLTQQEILCAIDAGQLQFRTQYIHGNPWFRLLRSEIEELVKNKKGKTYLKKQKLETELLLVKKEIRVHSKKLKELKGRQEDLEQDLNNLVK